jgi:mannosyltransferase OCH1-like enzyme
MTLAVDSSSSAAQQGANEKGTSAIVTTDSYGSSMVSGTNIDNISLEDLIAGKISSNVKPTAPLVKHESFTINILKSQVALTIPSANRNSNLQLAIYNLSGRLIVSQTISAVQAQNGVFIWNLSAKKDKLSNGAYVMKIKAGSLIKTLKMPSLR